MSKCANCGKEDTGIEFEVYTWHGSSRQNVTFKCCSEECKKEIEQFAAYVNKNATRFIALIIIGVLSFIPFIILYSIYKNDMFGILGTAAPLFIIGFAVVKYPFSTPQTNSGMGIKKGTKLTKIIGLSLISLGIIFILLYLILK